MNEKTEIWMDKRRIILFTGIYSVSAGMKIN